MAVKTYKIIIESAKDGLWGRWEHERDLVVAEGKTLENLKLNFIDALNAFMEESGNPGVTTADVNFEFLVDLENVIQVNNYINISRLAEHVGINRSLLRQYAKGIKYPGLRQALKIEKALRDIGSNLLNTRILVKE